MLAIGAGESSNPVGRYKVSTASSNGATFAIMIDTQTGKAWGLDVTAGNDLPKHANGGADAGNFYDPK